MSTTSRFVTSLTRRFSSHVVATGARCAAKSRRARRLFVERLEDRQLLACVAGQTTPCVEDPNLAVRTVIGNLTQPTTMAFLAANDFLVLEKASGQV